jgi:hypothetical protein
VTGEAKARKPDQNHRRQFEACLSASGRGIDPAIRVIGSDAYSDYRNNGADGGTVSTRAPIWRERIAGRESGIYQVCSKFMITEAAQRDTTYQENPYFKIIGRRS